MENQEHSTADPKHPKEDHAGPYRIEVIPAVPPEHATSLLNRFVSEGWQVQQVQLLRIAMEAPQGLRGLHIPGNQSTQVMDVLWVLLVIPSRLPVGNCVGDYALGFKDGFDKAADSLTREKEARLEESKRADPCHHPKW